MIKDGQTSQPVIERTLWYQHGEVRLTLRQAELATRTEPLLILGEAGMGKSHLLAWLTKLPGCAFCTARQLVGRYDPWSLLGNAEILVIDGLDEISAGKEGDAVDQVLRKLGELGYPRFVMSCRVADWRSATGTEAIQEQYSTPPTEFHLEPFSEHDALVFLTAALGPDRATEVIRHLDSKGLSGLLGNPQTLGLVAQVADAGPLPESKGDLFQRAVNLLRIEKKPAKSERLPATTDGLDAAGAAFAAMILTGNEAIVRSTQSVGLDGNLSLREIARLPGAASIGQMLDTRLFSALGPDRFGYLHRRIGEFLSAQWLAKQANSPRKRRRLLKLFQGMGLVPSSLRGIHAWMARDPFLTQSIIEADPLGLVEYGDADALTASHASQLLAALRRIAEENPFHYDWGFPSARSLFQPTFIPAIRREITSSEAPFALRRYLIRAAKGAMVAPSIEAELRGMLLDPDEVYGIRADAAETLVGHMGKEDWKSTIRTLAGMGDEDSARLGIEILTEIGCHIADDTIIIDLIEATILAEEWIVGILYPLETALPDDRLDGILDGLAGVASKLEDTNDGGRRLGSLTDFAYSLLARRLELGGADATNIWGWLAPFEVTYGYRENVRTTIHNWFVNNPEIRRDIQRLVVVEESGDRSVWHRVFELGRRSSGLHPSAADLAALLALLDPVNHSDEGWRELVTLAPLDDDVQAAVRPFLAARPELAKWMDEIANPQPAQWQLDEDDRKRKQRRATENRIEEIRNHYLQHIDQVRSGTPELLNRPAAAYMNRYSDLDGDLGPNARVVQWLGNEIAAAVREGFEAYLVDDQKGQTVDEIGNVMSRDEFHPQWLICAAALAERALSGRGFSDLPDERLLEGFCILLGTSANALAHIHGLEASVEAEISHRGLSRKALECLLEPQLAARCEHVDGLYRIMRSAAYADVAAELAIHWLEKFETLPIGVEDELLAKAIHSSRASDLRNIIARRVELTDTARRRTWNAAGLIVDFDQTATRLDQGDTDSELIWKLRDLGESRNSRTISDPALDSRQIEWIVSKFRAHWPLARLPSDGGTGNQNAWDASDYLTRLLRRLGGDPSDQATFALARLRDAPADGYTEAIRSIASEQTRLRVEANYIAPSLDAIEAVISDVLPKTISDLQAVMLEELAVVQSKIRSDDAESRRGFFSDTGIPYDEERCRDHLLGILRQGSCGVELAPETHVGGDKEVDITCATEGLRLPIEIKGQWHSQLWEAADSQLDRLYTVDWRAERRGIYLVLWFGNDVAPNKRLASPGRGNPCPETPDDLLAVLVSGSKAAKEGRVSIMVLDLTRS